MALDYKAAQISVTVDETILTPSFGIAVFSIYAVDGAILFRLKDESGWGDWIPLNSGGVFDGRFDCTRIALKSSTGTVVVQYFLQGER